MTIKVKVKLLGVFQGLSGRSQLLVEFGKIPLMREVVQKLVEPFSPEFERVLIDPELGDPRPNALILVNGIEISVLEGLETEVNDGDEVILIPVSHGG